MKFESIRIIDILSSDWNEIKTKFDRGLFAIQYFYYLVKFSKNRGQEDNLKWQKERSNVWLDEEFKFKNTYRVLLLKFSKNPKRKKEVTLTINPIKL